MPTYKPNRKNLLFGFFADREGESGLEYFVERSGEETILIFAADYIRVPMEERVLLAALVNWTKPGSDLPSITSRENIPLIPELDVKIDNLIGVRAGLEIQETEKRKYIREIVSTGHKRKLFIADDLYQLLRSAMDENPELEIFADHGKRVGFYLLDGNDRIIAYVPEWREEQLKLPENVMNPGKELENEEL
jgi:hypothetical protein